MFSLESPHQGDYNEYTQYTIFKTKKEIYPKLSENTSTSFISNLVSQSKSFGTRKFILRYQLLRMNFGNKVSRDDYFNIQSDLRFERS